VAFGPVPRGYEHKLNKKTRRAALRSALSARLAESAITVLDALELAEFKTRRVVELLDSLGLGGQSVLIVLSEPSAMVEVSARNIPNVSVVRAGGLNVYDVLRHSKLLLTKAAVEAVEARLGDGEKEGTA
jgi:large subunit ribosomal protein L4